ncbi:MAG: YtxH domain-containing protein [Prolixibacteraceae bacterium]
MESSKHTASLIGGLLIGALAGAALGILFAPHKGSKTRSNISNGAQDIAHDLKKKMKKEAVAMRRKVRDLENAAKDKMDDVKDTIKSKAEAL